MALHLWHFLLQEGYRVPEDISLVGFDDTDPMLDAAGQPLLTSVRIPLDDIGATAAELLLQLLDGASSETIHRVLPMELKIRRSTGPARKQ